MANEERRFLTGLRATDTNLPGLIMEDDGTVWLVNPGGSRTQLSTGGGGAGFTGWTEDASNPANVDSNGGDLVLGELALEKLILVPVDPADYASTFDYSSNDSWAGAMLVLVKDVSALAGGSLVLQIEDVATATQMFQLNGWGAVSVQESPGGGSDSASALWRAADGDVVLAVLTGQKKLTTEGTLEVIPADTAAVPITTAANNDGAAFAISGLPAAPTTSNELVDALTALGVVSA